MNYQFIRYEIADGVATLTLNRPDVLNSFHRLMADETIDALRRTADDPAVRAVVLTGAGRAFCAGQDLQAVLPREGEPAPDLGEIVRAELNVKELEFVSEEAELVSYRVKPNYRTLGPRFGKLMPQVAKAVESLDADGVAAAVKEGRPVGINVEGSEHELAPDDLQLVMEPLEGYEVESEAGRAVALALELDDELRREGLAREVVHAVQNARKQAGLEITDRIELRLAGDAELLEAARAHEEYVAGETLATSVSYGGADGAAVTIEGSELRIAVERAG